MAIFSFSSQPPIARTAGRSSVAAAAYRAGQVMTDERTGEVHDYSRKVGVLASEIVLPGGVTLANSSLAEFWNRIEKHHKRGDAVVAREDIAALPCEISREAQYRCADRFAREVADRYRVAVHISFHAPGPEGDQRNYHVHLLKSACYVDASGALGKKAVELDPIHCARHKIENYVDWARMQWEAIVNDELQLANRPVRISSLSLAAQGIQRQATTHIGVKGMAARRRLEALAVEADGFDGQRAEFEIEADRLEVERQAVEADDCQTESAAGWVAASLAADAIRAAADSSRRADAAAKADAERRSAIEKAAATDALIRRARQASAAAKAARVQAEAERDALRRRQAEAARVQVDDLEALEALLRASQCDVPGLEGVSAEAARPADLAPEFRAKLMSSGITLHIRMPVDQLAFVERDSGIRMRPAAALDSVAVAAALQVAAGKWDIIRLTGDDSFRALAIEQAAHLGLLDRIDVDNLPPELARHVLDGIERDERAARAHRPRH